MNKLKTIAVSAGIIAASALTLTACGNQYTSTANGEVAAKDYQSFFEYTANEYKNYVKLGDYKSVVVASVDRSGETISDDDVNSTLTSLQTTYKTDDDLTSGGTTASGDTIVLNYTGTIDGKEFDGGTATDQTYTIGSGKYISDLDKGLVGLQANKEYSIKATFPSDYSKSELAGKKAVFKVTITSIKRTTKPEITDEWVAANADSLKLRGYGSNLKTVDDLKAGIKTYLQDQQKRTNDMSILSEAIEEIKQQDGYSISGYPEAELNSYISNIESNVKSQYDSYGSYYGYDSYAAYLKGMYGYSSEDEFNSGYCTDQAKTYLESKMITSIIASENGIKVSADDITAYGNEYAIYYGFDSYQALVEQYGTVLNAEQGYRALQYKTAAFMASTVTQKTAVSVTVSTVNKDKKAVSGITVEIQDTNAKKKTSFTSSTDSTKLSLIPGTYVYHETKSADGYKAVSDITFTVSEDGKVKLDKDNGNTVTVKDATITVTNQKS